MKRYVLTLLVLVALCVAAQAHHRQRVIVQQVQAQKQCGGSYNPFAGQQQLNQQYFAPQQSFRTQRFKGQHPVIVRRSLPKAPVIVEEQAPIVIRSQSRFRRRPSVQIIQDQPSVQFVQDQPDVIISEPRATLVGQILLGNRIRVIRR